MYIVHNSRNNCYFNNFMSRFVLIYSVPILYTLTKKQTCYNIIQNIRHLPIITADWIAIYCDFNIHCTCTDI